jgi:uncharacterized protein
LKDAFDLWHLNIVQGNYRSHRYFDNLLLILHGHPPESCAMAGHCCPQYVVEADGSVFPCDFYALDEYCLGNFVTDSLEKIDARRTEIQFVEQSIEPHPECLVCKWYSLCRGGCRRDRDTFQAELSRNYFCPSYRVFFEYAWPRLERVYWATKVR